MSVVESVVFFYFLGSVLYVLVFSLAGKFAREKRIPSTEKYSKIALLVPAYKEDQIILSIVEYLLKQDYPSEYYDVIIIADSFQRETIHKLSQYPIQVLEVDFDKSTKAKSLNHALQHLPSIYDIAIVSDADNVPESQFLTKINDAYQFGYPVVQGRRIAKNQDTPFALLDTASEIINNHIFRKGFNATGLSSSLIGSGMAFPFKELKDKMANIHAVGGFDRELQLAFIKENNSIHYLDNAIVFDEKIESPQAFENQRRRWISSQFIYLKKYFWGGIKQLLKGNVSYFNIAVLYNLFLPRLLNLGALLILSVIATVAAAKLTIPYYYWWLLLLTYGIALLIAIPAKFFNRDLVKAISKLPQAFVIMFRSLLRMKGADKKFIHTVHTKTEIDNTIFYQKQK